MSNQIVIDLPEMVEVPAELEQEQEFMRRLIAVGLYKKGRLTMQNACEITQLSWQEFEKCLVDYSDFKAKHDFNSDRKQSLKSSASRKGKWAQLVHDVEEAKPLDGVGDKVLELTRGFRKNFIFRDAAKDFTSNE